MTVRGEAPQGVRRKPAEPRDRAVAWGLLDLDPPSSPRAFMRSRLDVGGAVMSIRFVSFSLAAALALAACGGSSSRDLTLRITHGVDDAGWTSRSDRLSRGRRSARRV